MRRYTVLLYREDAPPIVATVETNVPEAAISAP